MFVRIHILRLFACLPAVLAFNLPATTHYVDANNAHPVLPYNSWATAATNIQDAVNFAGFGDTILVTNGIYQYGGFSNSGSNRVNVVNNMTVQSVNGPAVTVIKGHQVPGTTNGASAVRCALLQNGARLSGFTLTGGATQNFDYGGGVKCDSTNATITNCVLVGNSAYDDGGGAYYGTLVNCSLISNSAPTMNVGGGGGAYNSVLVNCLLTGNFAVYNGGGASGLSTLINCTVVSNVSGATLGGASGTLLNCIVYYNLSYFNQPDTGSTGLLTNCCTSFSFSGQGANNFTNPPGFVDLAGGNLHLQIGSPCINAGNNSFNNYSTDLDGNPRVVGGTVDIGAYENQNTVAVHYVSLISASPVSPFTNWSTAATNIQDAVAVAQAGEFVVASNGIYNKGAGTIIYGQEANRVALTNPITLLGLYGSQSTVLVGGNQMRCVYVGSNAVLNGFTLVDGRTRTSGDIVKEQSGAGAWCETGGVISNCVFGGTNFPYADNANPNDNNTSQYEGGGVYGGTVYNSAFIKNNALDGGAAAAANLINCSVVGNTGSSGGGTYQGTASHCTFTSNSVSAGSGGGAYQSTLYYCALGNNSSPSGGGVWGGTLYNCTLSNNTASSAGGGAYGSTLQSCTIVSNASVSGGGAYQGALYNCVVISNAASGSGGGAYQSMLYNCTVVSNKASSVAGVYFGTLYNSIIYFNSAPAASNYAGGTLLYCDTAPLASGASNITNNPAFVNVSGGDFHLQASSPCINSGNNSYVATNIDLDGSPRITGGTVDIGAYEFQSPASVLSYAWAQQYGLPTDGSADYTDPDGDGMNNWQEWRVGTSPIDSSSVLRMLSAANATNPPGVTVTWQSVSGKNYFLQRGSDLSAQPAFSTVQTNIAGQAGTTSYTDTTATNNGPYYYRAGVQ